MWNPNMKPTPLTIKSLEISLSERIRRGKTSPINWIQENNGSSRPGTRLKSGSHLTTSRTFFTPELVNVPLEDLDPVYADAETFVIVTEKKLIHRFSAQNSLNIFSPFNPVRRTCISVLHHWIYRWFMIITVFVDSCLLTQPNHDHQLIVFYFFGATYTFDVVTNVIARGLILDQFAFLRDGWGILDLLLLVPYYLLYIGRHHFLCGLRSLKIAALIPSLKSMVKASLKTVADLRDMFLWTLFATWIFALVGYHFYKGISTQKCVRDFPEDGFIGEYRDLNWHAWVSNRSNWLPKGPILERKYYICGNRSTSVSCPDFQNLTCLQVSDHDDRLYSSMGSALMSTVQIMQQDSWDDIYSKILDLGGLWHAPYFVLTLFLGSFYTLNMILAVVSKSYDDLQKELGLDDKLECSRSNISRSNACGIEEKHIRDPDESNHNHNSNAELSIIFKYLGSYCKNPISNNWTWFTNLINVIAFDPFTELIMATITVANLIFLSTDHFQVEKNQQLYLVLVSGYQICGILFAIECILKFLACGPICYFEDKWNLFEFWQTILFFVEYKFEFNTRWMNALLSLRSLRIFQVARILPTVDSMLNGVLSAMGTVSDMTIVAIGVFYMFCVAGVRLFGDKIGVRIHRPESHWHFRDFWHSFMVIFRLLCGEWVESMLECVDDHGWTCIPFFILAVIVIDLIVLNLLLVMFLQRFSTRNLSTSSSNTNKIAIAVNRFKRLGMWMKVKILTFLRQKTSRIIYPVFSNQEKQNIQVEALGKNQVVSEETFCRYPKLRIKLQTIINNKRFKYFNIGITIIATISLSLRDGNLKSRPLLEHVLNVADNIILFFMVVEAVIKIVAIGFSAYIKNKWNRLDFIVVLCGILNIITVFFGYDTFAFLRSMRVFRLFSNFEGMRIIFNSLGRAMSKIFGLLLVGLLIWLVFAIIGVQLLNGRFHRCININDRSKILDARYTRNKEECLRSTNSTWDNELENFDNVESAYLRVLEIITFKGWIYTFNVATNSGDIDEQPSFERNFWISGYFVAVVLFGSFFAFNIFTGVLIDGLNEEKGKIEGNDTSSRKENGYQETRNYMLQKLKIKFLHADTHTRKNQKFILGVVTSKHFGIVILLNLVFNMVLLSMEQGSTSVAYRDTLLVLNGICTAVFASECLLNMFALKCKFFRNPRNMLELFTELVSIFDILWTKLLLKTSLVPFCPGLLRLVRFAYVSRYLRHVKAANGLRQLLSVLQISLPAFFNICVLLFLVVFVYALLGMELFKHYDFHFKKLPIAFNSLFPTITSAKWDFLMRLLSTKRHCNEDNNINASWICGNATVAGIYVISYLFITFVILVNMFSAVILETYSRTMKLVQCELGEEHFEMFYKILSQFDKENSQFVGCNNLSDLFESLESPLQVSKPNRCAISLMNISIYQGNLVHCADVLDAAITYLYFRKGVISAENFSKYQDEMKNEKGCEKEEATSTFQQQRELRGAKVIQRAWRNRNIFLNN